MEGCVLGFRTIENTLFVGTSTKGLGLCGGNGAFCLPNTRIQFQCGNTLYFEGGYYDIECEGIEPDIYVRSDMADYYVQKMCEYYSIHR